ncbi:MAG: ABC transporter ATP-binding protein [Bdellovibrionaceae bacterium]|jgi:ABC-2 type transport system ATP-binding protein|nr:ABC transporter ATP-binding protein [Pseudobdellovibrionaceae bacterium]
MHASVNEFVPTKVAQLSGVKKQFVKQVVLQIGELEIYSGDRIALIGGNGAGKTTLIRCMLGHYKYDGSIDIFGMKPRADRVKILGRVGFVPQLPPPLTMTVKELVEFSAALYKDSSAENIYKVAKDLQLDLEPEEKKPFHNLSGGMKQKLLIALALGKKTDLLIMDEPSANLDPHGRKILFQQLQGMPKESVMLLSSHRIDEIKGLVNRVIEMDCGKIISDKRFDVDDFNQSTVENVGMTTPIQPEVQK